MGEKAMKKPGKRTAPIICLTSLALSYADCGAAPSTKSVSCSIADFVNLKFDVPAQLGDLPEIDFSYPSKVTVFSFRDRNLLAIAVDEADPSRVRLVISAQLKKGKGTYEGQFVADFGGNQLQLDNGPVICRTSH
jgi:hypothetical protein